MSGAWRTIAVVSIGLNLVIAGAAIGGYAAGARFEPPGARAEGGPRAERPIRTILKALPQERRGEMRREIARTFAQSGDLRKEARDARASLVETVQAEPYDAAAVKAALARMRAADSALSGRFHDAVADQLGRAAPDERRAVLRALVNRRAAPANGRAAPDPQGGASIP
ncbi:MAG: periplasmic heavy metal sensor [Caulobacterales bacterium]|jgi:uncharacterized membrane protein